MSATHKSRHTPAPWVVVGVADKSDKHRHCVMTETLSAVASVYCRKWKHGHTKSDPESDANALLIAMAPTQHAELIEVERLLSDYVSGKHVVEMCAFAERLEAVRKAIGKSKGAA